jgi:hypothetical protein
MIKFQRSGKSGGKTAYDVIDSKREILVGQIQFDGTDWVHCKVGPLLEKGRVTRWATLSEAKDEALKAAG